MKSYRRLNLCSVAPAAIAAMACGPVWAGTFDDPAFLSFSGDGIVYVDTKEGVEEPGLMAITTTPNADFPNTRNPSGIDNCLMASNPANTCLAESGSGKRIKTWLQGAGELDISLGTLNSGGISEYFYYGKTSNHTGARMTGVTLQFGTGTGSDFVAMDTSDPAVAALFDGDYINKFNLPDGLFGTGGQEGAGTGFFDDSKALLSVALTDPATLDAQTIGNPAYQAIFGEGILDNSMLPKAMLWDASETALASEEGVPIAWFDRSQDQWLYGTLGVPASSELDEKLQLLADELGMTVAELGYVSGDAIPAEVLAAMEAGALFQEGPIEDLRNLNMNFIIDLGDVDGGQVTMRIIPNFADIVSAARTKQQFTMAAILDAAANVPFFHSGDHELYQAAIDEMLALDGSKIAAALDSMSFRFAQAFSSLGFEYSRNQIAMMRDSRRPAAGTDGVMSSQGSANTHKAGDDLYWIFGLDGARAAYDTTSDGIGYDIGFTAVSIGLEKVVDANFSYGVLLGGSFGTAEAYSGRGEIESNGLSLAAFARSRFGDGGFLQGMLGYQDLSYESEREIMGRTAKGDTDGSQVFASLDAEYMFPSGAFNFGPTASLEYYKISVDSFKESGADIFNLTFGEQSGDLMLGTIGVRGDYLIPNAAGGTLLTGSLGYTFADGDDISVQTGLVGLPGASYTIAGMDDDWVDLQIGFESNLDMSGKSQGIIRGGYRGSYGSSYESHGIHLGLNVEF